MPNPSKEINSMLTRTLKGTAIISIFTYLAIPLGYFIRVLYARVLTVEEFGLFYSILALLGFISIFNDFGLSQALAHFLPRYISKKQYGKAKAIVIYALSFQIGTAILIAFFLWFSAPYLATKFFRTNLAIILLRCFVAYFIAYNLTITLENLFRGFQEEKFYGSFESLRLSAILLLSILTFTIPLKNIIYFALIWGLIPFLLACIYFVIFLKRHFEFIKVKPEFDWTTLKNIFKYALPVMIGTATSIILLRLDVILLTYLRDVSHVGYYSIATSIANAVISVVSALSMFLLPYISANLNKKALLSRYISLVFKAAFIFFLPITLIFFLFSKEAIIVLFSAKYLPAVHALMILSFFAVFGCFNSLLSSTIAGLGKPKIVMYATIIGALANAVIDILLIPKFGASGAAIGTGTVWLTVTCIGLFYLKKALKITIKPIFNYRTILAGTIFATSIFFLKKILFMNLYLEATLITAISLSIYFFLIDFFKVLKIKTAIHLFLNIIPHKQLLEKFKILNKRR